MSEKNIFEKEKEDNRILERDKKKLQIVDFVQYAYECLDEEKTVKEIMLNWLDK